MADYRGRHRASGRLREIVVYTVTAVVTIAVTAGVSVLVIAADTGMPAAQFGGGAPHLVVSPASRANVPARWTP